MTALTAVSAGSADTPTTSLIDSLTIAETRFTVAWAIGRAHLALKDICDFVGVAWRAQWRRIETTADRFNYHHMMTVGADGKQREMVCLPVAEVPRWLDGINPNKLAADVAERLGAFKTALFDSFIGQQIARLAAERDRAVYFAKKASFRVRFLSRMHMAVAAGADKGWSFAEIRAAGSTSWTVSRLSEAAHELVMLGEIAALPAGTPPFHPPAGASPQSDGMDQLSLFGEA